jgi:hypothetical protein
VRELINDQGLEGVAMGRYPQKGDGHGSLFNIQRLINCFPHVIETELKQGLELSRDERFSWVSPLKYDDYAEYRDQDFIQRVTDKELKVPLKQFWPRYGPQWDALGKTNQDKIFLVEAKANIPEILSSPLGAKSEASVALIHASLDETKSYLNSKSQADWTTLFYQYCNRLAHLYFLRVKNNLLAYLLFVYFIGDGSVEGPASKAEWLGALQVMKLLLGLDKKHKLSPYVIDVFIDVSNPRHFLIDPKV